MQSGIGRTGAWFAHTRHGVVPDVVTLAKGLGGGIPIGAVIALGARAAGLLGAGQHGTTFGGNPVASAAALATLHVIERDGLLANTRLVGARLRDGILGLGSPLVAGITGEGLFLGVQLTKPVAAQVASAALTAGFIVNAVAPDVVRLAPPLILTLEQADSFVAALPALLTDLADQPSPATRPDPALASLSADPPAGGTTLSEASAGNGRPDDEEH